MANSTLRWLINDGVEVVSGAICISNLPDNVDVEFLFTELILGQIKGRSPSFS